MSRFVGIDPSTKTGLVILNADGEVLDQMEITTKEKGDLPRFTDLALKVMSETEIGDVIAIEGFSFASKGRAVSTQYGIGWLMRNALYENNRQFVEVPPTTLKKFATGKGNMKKENMVLPIFKRWGFESDSDNVRDAYVLAQIGRALHGKGTFTKEQIKTLDKVVRG